MTRLRALARWWRGQWDEWRDVKITDDEGEAAMPETRADVTIHQGIDGYWSWRCETCGWLGINCGSRNLAVVESDRHECTDDDAGRR